MIIQHTYNSFYALLFAGHFFYKGFIDLVFCLRFLFKESNLLGQGLSFHKLYISEADLIVTPCLLLTFSYFYIPYSFDT